MIITRQLTDSASASTASDIQLGSCVSKIGQGAFSGYTNITEVEFPDSLTTIDDGAFSGSSITTVEIPSGVTSIGVNAFKDCSNLDRVGINATIPPTLGSDAFDNTSNCPIYVPVTSYSDYKTAEDWIEYASRIRYEGAPYKVKFIDTNGEEIFINCDSSSSVSKPSPMPSGITTTIFGECIEEIGNFSNSTLGDVFISNSVKTIGGNAFQNCTVNSISFSEGLETIGASAFASCSGFTSIDIPNSVTSIGASAFAHCSGLTSVNIPSSVTSIGSSAFGYCKGLTSVTIPSSVVNIGGSAFISCSKLFSITMNRATPPTLGGSAFNYTSNCPIYVPQESFNLYISAENWSVYESRITYIGEVYKLKYNTIDSEYGFVRCNDSPILTSTEIENHSISSADIGSCVTSIGEYAFYNCIGLKSVTIPNSVTSIGAWAFQGRDYLTSVTIGNGVTNIGTQAFAHCSGLTSVNIPSSVTSIGSSAFDGTPWWNTYSADTSNQYGNIIYINDIAYKATATTITSCTFRERTVSISNSAFYSCESLTSVTIPNNVTTIGNGAFWGCRRITSVNIGNSVTSIGNSAFNICVNLTSVTVNATTPPTLGSGAFEGTSNCPIYVPSASVDTYKAASGWSTYASRIYYIGEPYKLKYKTTNGYGFVKCNDSTILTSTEIENSISSADIGSCVTTIDNSAFSDCTTLTSVTIGNSVTSIGDGAFVGCKGLSSIVVDNSNTVYDSRNNCNAIIETSTNKLVVGCKDTVIPNSVTSIGNNAFSGCTSLTTIDIPSSVTSISNKAFARCSGLTSVTIGNSVTSIGSSAFRSCSSLTSVTIPSSVTSISGSAFSYCGKLTSVTVNAATPPTLSSYVFSNTNNCPIYVPSASVDAYKAASGWSSYASRIQAIPNS